jgi:iron complex outermembrane recepter protein
MRHSFPHPVISTCVACLSCILLWTATPATGLAASQTEPVQLQEVVVTATLSGALNVQTVPMPISVIAPGALDSQGLGGVSDFLGELPSVAMQSLSPGENSIAMRGLATNALDPTNSQNRSLVAIYLDDADITQNNANPDLHVYDLERIEVLRGPQGTLYGAGSMAGTIRLITKKPDSTRVAASADASVSETEDGGTNTAYRGSVNLPIIQNQLAASLTGYRGEDSGYIANLELDQPRANPDYSTQGRLAVRWTPLTNLIVDGSVTLARLNALGRNGVYPQLGEYQYESLTPEPFTDYFNLYNLTAHLQLGSVSLVSSTSYIQRRYVQTQSTQFAFEALFDPGTLLPGTATTLNDIHEFEQEFRLVGDPNAPLRWILGAYFQRQSRYFPQTDTEAGFDGVYGQKIGDPTFNTQTLYNTPLPDTIVNLTQQANERQAALFGEITYPVLRKLDFTLGARYFNFREDFERLGTGPAGELVKGVPNIGTGTEPASGVNPRAVLSYKFTPDLMAYLEGARGFRYGGVNNPIPLSLCQAALSQIGLTQGPAAFGPDHLWSYTLGEKGTFDNERLRLNVDGFLIDWNDVQTIHNLSCGFYFTQNKGKVLSRGAEFDSAWRATSALTLGASGSYTNATADGAIPNLTAQSGDQAPFFPDLILTASGEYNVPLPREAALALRADYTYRSSSYTAFNPLSPAYREIPSSRFLNASLTYMLGHWSVSLYGTNLMDDHLVSSILVNNFLSTPQPGALEFWGRPRTVGIHLHLDVY